MKRSQAPEPAVIGRAAQAPLRVLCTEITPYRQLQARAEADLGFPLEFEQHDFITAQRIAATEPQRYDIYDQCFHNLDIVWHWRAVQPIDVGRIEAWDEVTDLTKTGTISAEARRGRGDAPVSRLFVQDDHSLSRVPSNRISMLPTVHNFDCIGINEVATGLDVDTQVSSWGELLDPRWHGRAAVVDEPAIGVFDLALAVQARKTLSFEDIGNMTVAEIDALFDLTAEMIRSGHFMPFWRTTDQARKLFETGDVVAASMWSPAVIALKSRAVRIRQAVPVEGYRAWHGGLCLARHLEADRLDRAYAYLNWFLSGWPGAVMARQGYYMSVPSRVRAHLEPDEWDYWYEGKPAARPLPDPTGNPAIRAGETRSGGSYWARAAHIAVWNTTMDEHNYLVRRWGDLVDLAATRQARPRRNGS